MLNTVIFSKNRACQLDLLLRSIKLLWKDYSKNTIKIIINSTSEEFKKSYNICIKEHPEFSFIPQNVFKEDLIFLTNETNPYTIFFVDDMVFKNEFDLTCPEFHEFRGNREVMCLSLRMYPKIKYCQVQKFDTPPPTFNPDLTWKWEGLSGDWGYPYSIDSHIFRTADIINVIRNGNYTYPNNFEDCLLRQMIRRPLMKCFKKSKTVNIPLNRIGPTHSPCVNISAESLNSMYLEGKRLSLKGVLDIDTVSPHQEIPLEWEEK